ncbi:MAG TPA: hypothetical protein PKL69_10095 [Agitococcus sp.]|nr:hypothetical protein [Agitococcus sp.]HNC03697.1 hypothetical protein [Agitococcus sp.]HNL80672.1 hypothetical protein [Agitococcus sp.]
MKHIIINMLCSFLILGCSKVKFEPFKIEFLENEYGYKMPIDLAGKHNPEFIKCIFSKDDNADVIDVGYSKEVAFYVVNCPRTHERVYVFRTNTKRL